MSKIKLLLLMIFCLFYSYAWADGVRFLSYGISGKDYPKYFDKSILGSFGIPIKKEHILMECGFSLPWKPDSDWDSSGNLNLWLVSYKSVTFEVNQSKAAVHTLILERTNNNVRFDNLLVTKSTTKQHVLRKGGRLLNKNEVFLQDKDSDDGSGYIITFKKSYARMIKPLNAC